MAILTSKQAWYQRNREKVIEKARKWQLEHPERFRDIQKASKQRIREQLHAEKVKIIRQEAPKVFVPAPGWDDLKGDYELWCIQRGIDPKKSWDEPTDEFFG